MPTFLHRIVGFLASGLLALGLAGHARAASLQVAPVTLTFSAGESAQALYLSNTGDAPINAQIRVYDWSQQNGQTQLTVSQALIVSPPITLIPPGKTQMVRVVRRAPAVPESEQSLRLIVDELPAPGDEAKPQRASEVQFLLRYSLPVFIQPKQAELDLARVSAWISASGGQATLNVENRNNIHLKLSRVSLLAGDGSQRMLTEGLLGYVLPGEVMSWPLDNADVSTSLQANVNDREAPHAFPIQQR